MILSLLIAVLVALPGMLLQLSITKLHYILISLACLSFSCTLTLLSLPSYCLKITVLAFTLIFLVYTLMLFHRSKHTF